MSKVSTAVNYIIANEANLRGRYLVVANEATNTGLDKAIEKTKTAPISKGYKKRVQGYFSNLSKVSIELRQTIFANAKDNWNLDQIRGLATASVQAQKMTNKEPLTKTAQDFVDYFSLDTVEDFIGQVVENINNGKSAFKTEAKEDEQASEPTTKDGVPVSQVDLDIELNIMKLEELKALDDETFEELKTSVLESVKKVVETNDLETLRLIMAVLPNDEVESKEVA